MLVYNLVSIGCLVILGIIVTAFLSKFFSVLHDREELIKFIRHFKKGNCAVIYFVAIPLYTMGFLAHPEKSYSFIEALLNGISKTTTLVVLRYDTDSISYLLENNVLFSIATYICFFLVAVNAILLILSLTHQKILGWLGTMRWSYGVGRRMLIVGYNPGNVKIYESTSRKRAKGKKKKEKLEARKNKREEKNQPYQPEVEQQETDRLLPPEERGVVRAKSGEEKQRQKPRLVGLCAKLTEQEQASLYARQVRTLGNPYDHHDVEKFVLKALKRAIRKQRVHFNKLLTVAKRQGRAYDDFASILRSYAEMNYGDLWGAMSEEDRNDKEVLDKLKTLTKDKARDFNAYLKTAEERLDHQYKKKLRETTPKRLCDHVIIINTGDDEKNIKLCVSIQNLIETEIDKQRQQAKKKLENNRSAEKEMAEKELTVAFFEQLSVYVFGDPRHEGVYTRLVETSYGCIRYINKYQQIAVDFVDHYPLSKYMQDKIDPKTGLVDPECKINVALIGFGKTNRQLFLSSVANNQFLTRKKDGTLDLKKVSYHIFDKDPLNNQKNLNHTYYRFRNEFFEETEEGGYRPIPALEGKYLDFPSLPADEAYHELDINDPKFYRDLREIVTQKNSVNYIIIAFGTDLENTDMAQKLVEKKREWGVDRLNLFVKVRSGVSGSDVFARDDCFMIADEGRVVYHAEKITNDRLERMAKLRNQIYMLEWEVTNRYERAHDKTQSGMSLGEPIEAQQEGKEEAAEYLTMQGVETEAKYKWYVTMTQIERDSNVYGVLSIRSKLHMMGLDYREKTPANSGFGMSCGDYFAQYDAKREIEYYENGKKNLEASDKPIVKYTLNFPESLRGNLAVQEHYRWNSYMISRGMVPATRDTIKSEQDKDGKYTNGKNYKNRYHGNVTTMKGLVAFRRLICGRDSSQSELSADVIKYDYQLLDDVHWLLNKEGYQLVLAEKASPKESSNDGKASSKTS